MRACAGLKRFITRSSKTKMDEHFFEARGIYYRTNNWVSGRPTLVFVHGLSGSSSAWRPYEERLKNKHNLLTFDLRGHGRSLKRKAYSAYEIKHFAKDLRLLLEHCGASKIVLISHSFGTLIALEFLVLHQQMVDRTIFLSTSFSPSKSRVAKLIAPLLKITSAFEYLPFRERTAGHIDYAKYPNTGDWNLRRMLADVPNTGLRVYLYCTRQSLSIDLEEFLTHITIPVLIMHGKKDSIFPVKNSLIMKERIKGAQLILLEDTDHIIVLNKADEVVDAILRFICI